VRKASAFSATEDEDLENPLTELTAGDTLHGKLTVVVPEERNQVAVEVALPAGLELINFALDNVDQSLQVTTEGEFRQPPALVYEMYFPENFGRSSGTIMTVSD
jgi:uncharacterized protein YfaS (alpha-2-macroglobulin family)